MAALATKSAPKVSRPVVGVAVVEHAPERRDLGRAGAALKRFMRGLGDGAQMDSRYRPGR